MKKSICALMLVSFTSLLGCGPKDIISHCDADSIDYGVIDASIDGEPWLSGTAAFVWSGDSLQIVSEATDGFRVSIFLTESVEGSAPKTGDTPMTFDLSSGGFALLYPDGENSMTSANESGTAIITSLDDDIATGCFRFTSGNNQGTTTAEIDFGRFNAEASEL